MFSKTSRVFRHFAHTIMPPRRTRDERAAIQIMFRAGFQPWRISRRLGIPYETVRRWIGRGNDTDERPRRRVSTRTIRRAMMMLCVGETLRSSARILGISHMTVWRRARRLERNRRGFIPYKIRRRLRLNTVQKQKRLNYIQALGASRWPRFRRLRNKIYFDQKPWQLGHYPNRQNNRCWRRNRRNVRTYSMDQHPTTLHCLVGVNYWEGTSDVYWYTDVQQYQRGMN